MKTLAARSLLTAFISSLMMVASTQSLYAENLDVLGNLQAKGTIHVTSDGAPAPARLADTTYAYVSGDTIRTGNGTGVLEIAGLGRIALAQDTEASVVDTSEGVDVDLRSGAVAYALTQGSDVTIQAAGMTVQPSRSPLRKVSNEPQQVIGWVNIAEDGKVQVGSRNGRIEVRQGDSVQVVEAGQQSVLQMQGGKLIATQAGGAGAAGGLGISPGLLAGLIVLGGVGLAAGVVASSSGDDEPASP